MFSPARSLRSGKRRRGSKILCFPEIGEFVPKRPQGGGRFAPAPHKRRSHLALIRRERVNQRKVTTSFVWRRGEASSPLRAFRDELADFRKAQNFRAAASLA